MKYLASQEEVKALLVQLASHIEELHHMSTGGQIELDLDPEDLVDWEDGVEHWQKMTEQDLYDTLGFPDGKIPFLVTEIDVDVDIGVGAHVEEDAEDIAPPSKLVETEKQPFALKWHQLVGVTKLVQCALKSQPVLLMDDVGLGKTLQVITFFAVIAYYRQFYSKSQRYPGLWSES